MQQFNWIIVVDLTIYCLQVNTETPTTRTAASSVTRYTRKKFSTHVTKCKKFNRNPREQSARKDILFYYRLNLATEYKNKVIQFNYKILHTIAHTCWSTQDKALVRWTTNFELVHCWIYKGTTIYKNKSRECHKMNWCNVWSIRARGCQRENLSTSKPTEVLQTEDVKLWIRFITAAPETFPNPIVALWTLNTQDANNLKSLMERAFKTPLRHTL